MNKHITNLFVFTFFLLAFSGKGQKITINFNAVPTIAPSISVATLKYDKDFAYSFTFDDATDDVFSTALPFFRGGFVKGNNNLYQGLTYTDGCGNSIPFKAGIAWNTANLGGINVHTGNVADLLTWKQLDTLFNAGWDVFNHSYSHKSSSVLPNMTGTDYMNEIDLNPPAIQAYTQKKIQTPFFVVPAGDTVYNKLAFAKGYKAVFNQSGTVLGYGGLDITNGLDLTSGIIHRELFEESLTSAHFFDKIAAQSNAATHFWYNEFTHRIDNFMLDGFFSQFENELKRIYYAQGGGGRDRMWMAPLQEVAEYLTTSKNISYTTKLTGSRLEITFNLSKLPTWMLRHNITIKINANETFSTVDATSGIVTTFRGSGTNKIVNIDFESFLTANTDLPAIEKIALTVYPNPALEKLSIEIPTDIVFPARLTIFDATGKIMYESVENSVTVQKDIAGFPAGFYSIRLQDVQKIFIGKFVK